MKKKLLAALMASLFAGVTFAQASGPAAPPSGDLAQSPSEALGTTRSTTHRVVSGTKAHKHKVSHHQKKPVVLDHSKLDGKSSLQ
ncbi:hypothetical protein CPT_Musica_046 [Burkholderia phage Musica]|uniref:Uncharacterized protein n=1 Tax=Burkholderia phage Musica TaxID=2924903 RepID=A0AAE9K7F6_9CAUD|nr:hypothetical protein CPT_Musica_046 [Burkholderia phage Musica]